MFTRAFSLHLCASPTCCTMTIFLQYRISTIYMTRHTGHTSKVLMQIKYNSRREWKIFVISLLSNRKKERMFQRLWIMKKKSLKKKRVKKVLCVFLIRKEKVKNMKCLYFLINLSAVNAFSSLSVTNISAEMVNKSIVYLFF